MHSIPHFMALFYEKPSSLESLRQLLRVVVIAIDEQDLPGNEAVGTLHGFVSCRSVKLLGSGLQALAV